MRWLALLLQRSKIKDFIILLIETINFVSQYLTEENFAQVLAVLNQIKEITLKIGQSLFGLSETEVAVSEPSVSEDGVRSVDASSLLSRLEDFKKEI
jgi:hypothetical protein